MKTVLNLLDKMKTMKRIALRGKTVAVAAAVLLTLSFSSLPMSAAAKDSVTEVMRSYRKSDGVQYLNVNSFLLWIAGIISGDDDARQILGYLNRVAIVYAEDASDDLKREIMDSVNIELENGYQIMTEVKDETDEIAVWCRLNDDRISEMVVVSGSESAVVYLKGKGRGFPVSEIARLVSDGGNMIGM